MSEPPYRPQPPYRPEPGGRPEQPYRPAPRDVGARADVTAAWEARRELGPEYDEHIAAGLADRVEQLVAYRSAELRQRGSSADADREMERTDQRHRFVLGIISLGVGVPITGIAVGVEGLPALVVAWAGIVGVNLAQSLGRRRRS